MKNDFEVESLENQLSLERGGGEVISQLERTVRLSLLDEATRK
jgi:hypothetical protein